MRTLPLAMALLLAACSQPAPAPAPEPEPKAASETPPEVAPPAAGPAAPPTYPPVEPPAPGTPGGLPDDRTPISEAPFTPQSAHGAADVVQRYFALIGEKKYAEAWALWSDGGKASGQTESAFAADLARHPQYNGLVGAPGEIEGAAGSLFVEVPVVIYGRKPDGSELHRKGKAVLRRVNDVPGSTAEQRRWHIARLDLGS